MNKKVVLVAYLHGNGGAERQIILLANNLIKFNYCVYLVILADNKIRYDIDQNVIVVDLSYREIGRFRILKRYIALLSFYRQIRPDISIHYNYQSAYFSCLMPKGIPGKIIYSERGDPADKEYKGILGLMRKLTINRINGFVFQTDGAKHYFSKIVQGRAVVIPNSVAVPEHKYGICKNRDKRIITVGRLHPQKNQELLIRAFASIAHFIPDYSLEIYGEGVLKEYLLGIIRDLGLADRVFIKHPVKNIFEVMWSASLFVLSSDYEGLPNSLMEAMALGVPSISTDCRPGGARSLILDGVNGFIVPINDKFQLANKILFLLQNEKLALQFSQCALQIFNVHSDSVIFKKWDVFLKQL